MFVYFVFVSLVQVPIGPNPSFYFIFLQLSFLFLFLLQSAPLLPSRLSKKDPMGRLLFCLCFSRSFSSLSFYSVLWVSSYFCFPFQNTKLRVGYSEAVDIIQGSIRAFDSLHLSVNPQSLLIDVKKKKKRKPVNLDWLVRKLYTFCPLSTTATSVSLSLPAPPTPISL